MKAGDIIRQLQAVLPSVTGLFTDDVSISSLSYSGGTVTAVTSAPHGLATGKYANVVGSTNPIANVSMVRSGAVMVCKTATDHDLTLGRVDIKNGGKTVEITGATEAEFNGVFNLRSVTNRREYEIDVADSGPTSATGAPLLQDGSAQPGFNGRYAVTVVDATTFTYTTTESLYSVAGGTPLLKSEARVSGAVDYDTADRAYTEQGDGNLWAFAVLGDVIASKDRNTTSDMTSVNKKNTGMRQRLSQPFTIYVFAPSINDIGGRASRDLMEDVSVALFRSLIGVRFDTGYHSSNQYVSTFVSHGFTAYSKAYYVHEFNFELAADLTFEDTTGYDFDVAFRDVAIEISPDFGTQTDPATADLDLDEVPLP